MYATSEGVPLLRMFRSLRCVFIKKRVNPAAAPSGEKAKSNTCRFRKSFPYFLATNQSPPASYSSVDAWEVISRRPISSADEPRSEDSHDGVESVLLDVR
jgi:hypothetical protein